MIDALGDRMKGYEACYDIRMTRRIPIILRVDGRSFHTWTRRNCTGRPFDGKFIEAMDHAARTLCSEISGAVAGFVQSDEISLVLRNDQSEKSDAWFGNRMQKLCSISASVCSVAFNSRMAELTDGEAPPAYFDSRVMYMPDKEEVFNCILWRQRDCIRNSVSGLAQAHFPPKELDRMNSNDKLKMLAGKGVDWEMLPMDEKYGAMVRREARNGCYGGIEFVRKVFFVDTLFGKVNFENLEQAYDFSIKEEK